MNPKIYSIKNLLGNYFLILYSFIGIWLINRNLRWDKVASWGFINTLYAAAFIANVLAFIYCLVKIAKSKNNIYQKLNIKYIFSAAVAAVFAVYFDFNDMYIFACVEYNKEIVNLIILIVLCCVVFYLIQIIFFGNFIKFFKNKNSFIYDFLTWFYSFTGSYFVLVNIFDVRNFVFTRNLMIKYFTCFNSLFLAFLMLGLIYMIYGIKRNNRTSIEKADNSVLDMRDVFYDNISGVRGDFTGLEEKAVDYDLLNRGYLIKQLTNSITKYNLDESYVIGLEGKWGSGKSTIINNAKKELSELKNLKICDFDPWLYGSEEALTKAFIDLIFDAVNIGYKIRYQSAVRKSLVNIVSKEVPTSNLILKIFNADEDFDSNILKIKDNIKKLVESQDKKIVIFIDNLDRANGDNILLVFKLIGTVLDIPNIIYVVSYDQQRMNDILKDTQKIDPHYTEKIIKQEIKVPEINNEDRRYLYTVIIKKLLSYRNVYDIKNFKTAIDFMCENITDTRTFKRTVNFIFSSIQWDAGLDYADQFSLELIHYANLPLYNEIKEHKDYFIEKIFKNFASRKKEDDEFLTRKFEYFESLFKDKEAIGYREVLQFLFPYINQDWNCIIVENSKSSVSISKPDYFSKYFNNISIKEIGDDDKAFIYEMREVFKNYYDDEFLSKRKSITDKSKAFKNKYADKNKQEKFVRHDNNKEIEDLMNDKEKFFRCADMDIENIFGKYRLGLTASLLENSDMFITAGTEPDMDIKWESLMCRMLADMSKDDIEALTPYILSMKSGIWKLEQILKYFNVNYKSVIKSLFQSVVEERAAKFRNIIRFLQYSVCNYIIQNNINCSDKDIEIVFTIIAAVNLKLSCFNDDYLNKDKGIVFFNSKNLNSTYVELYLIKTLEDDVLKEKIKSLVKKMLVKKYSEKLVKRIENNHFIFYRFSMIDSFTANVKTLSLYAKRIVRFFKR